MAKNAKFSPASTYLEKAREALRGNIRSTRNHIDGLREHVSRDAKLLRTCRRAGPWKALRTPGGRSARWELVVGTIYLVRSGDAVALSRWQDRGWEFLDGYHIGRLTHVAEIHDGGNTHG